MILIIIFPILITWISRTIRDYKYMKMPAHNPNHPGLIKITKFGKKDVFCPKCKSPYCINWTVRGKTPVTAVTRSRLKRGLFSSSIQVETTYLGGDVYELKRIRCMSCGEVFKI